MRHQVGVDGHQAGLRMQRQVERVDVAKAQQGLGIGSDRVGVDPIEVAQREPAAGQGKDGPHV